MSVFQKAIALDVALMLAVVPLACSTPQHFIPPGVKPFAIFTLKFET